MNAEIKKVEFLYKNQPNRRKIKITMKSGNIIYIESCCESWQQYGGSVEELYKTMKIAEKFNNWLHGKDCKTI